VKENNNLIDWNQFPRKEYKTIKTFIKGRQPESLSIEELFNLIENLKDYRNLLPDEEFIFGKMNLSYRKYPKTMLSECTFWISTFIDLSYDEYVYLNYDDKIIPAEEARYCQDPSCSIKDSPLNLQEDRFHLAGISKQISPVDCGN
jgi:hypothetical protein